MPLRSHWYNPNMFWKRRLAVVLIFSVGLLSACTNATPEPEAPTTPAEETLRPYPSETPTRTPVPVELHTPTTTATATQTPTPFIYTIKESDDMFGLSLRYGIPLDALKTANPSVNPNAMGPGTELVIPITATSPPTHTPTVAAAIDQATLTPIPGGLPVYCYADASGGAWCLVDYRNESSDRLENVSARVSLQGQAGMETLVQTAQYPLNIVAAGARILLAAYFQGPLPQNFFPSAEADFSLPVMPDDARYLQTSTTGLTTQFSEYKRVATVSGSVSLPDMAQAPVSLWVLGIAYNEQDQPVAFRRWEAALPITPAAEYPFSFVLYSLGAPITRVETIVEARPTIP